MLMNDWVHIKQQGKSLVEYFIRHNYKKIAIYGMNYVGETLISELKSSDIEVVCGIDKNAEKMASNIKLVKPENFSEEADAIIVTPITYFEDIYDELIKKVSCPIISMEDIIYEELR